MKLNYAILKDPASDKLSNVVFQVNSPRGLERQQMELLRQLMMYVSRRGLNVNQAVLAFQEGEELKFFGSRNLVDHLTKNGLPPWTHSLKLLPQAQDALIDSWDY